MSTTTEQTLRYARPSLMSPGSRGNELMLSTSGGVSTSGETDHPRFFDDFLGHAEQNAAALLAVSRVARTRFYTPPGMLAAALRAADPVVTSNGDRLRFESFSACCGVYARLDLLPGSLEAPALASGTTNVDFNPPVREALARVGGRDPLHLRVGEDVVVTTLDGSVTEKKVPLPERWLRGFAEAQVAAAGMEPVIDVAAVEARRFLRSLPRTPSRGSLWVTSTTSGLRLASRPSGPSVGLSGVERLRVAEPLLRFARRLRIYTRVVDDGAVAASVWEVELDDARLVLGISPERSRGFSGEGGVLVDLADDAAVDDADLVSAVLAFEPVVDVDHLSCETRLTTERVRRALTRLGAAGRVGFDVAERAYFHRELPYDRESIDRMHPRLAGARALVADGAVRFVRLGPAGGGDDWRTAHVRSGDVEHVVRLGPQGDRCTCPWFARHRDLRGPCKHVLAARAASTS
ncbi:SWIM zinc finger family protein [Cellulosimicrobium sp. Marseille-Q4280]|uniref:SWIM zinc finger family protein n=1 Tax=Cellulosimicrobium sp. Marseille-Q4280 TaxID=2937992 RepID=UPI00203C657C|nr:SWIM zinc finger family protein [Cellulosimicrobium sp. Marseille-Q4280]